MERLIPIFGLFAMICIAWIVSERRRAFPWRVVLWGISLKVLFGSLLLRTELGQLVFVGANKFVVKILGYSQSGVHFVFGEISKDNFSIAFGVLPVIIFSGSIIGILYHLGLVQKLVEAFSYLMKKTMNISGAESLAATANIFVGMTEAPLLVRPYIEKMTRSGLFCLMTTGMSTVAGSVLIAYSGLLGGQSFAGHLIVASLISAPAGIVISKVMVPEDRNDGTAGNEMKLARPDSVNLIDAASQGALGAMRLAACVGTLLIVFVALVALLNDGINFLGTAFGISDLSLERIFGWAFAPVAWLLGIPWSEAQTVGALLGVKTVLNEFLAFEQLSGLISSGGLSERSQIISAYALCGFANFGSLAILIGGIGGMAPQRRAEVANLGLRCVLSGTLSTLMTGCIAAILI
ncbi:NupC/NupG family nucleoside CNT transporter [Myxococcota bacterium]|nr:NupC/NupG family nucleoside CNT transporter [Myxococcota bacterium]